MTYAKDKEEIDFAYKVRRAMTESSENLPEATLERLATARQLALSRQKQAEPSRALAFGGVLAGNNGVSFSKSNTLASGFEFLFTYYSFAAKRAQV